jgi:hypothetical protein
MGSATIGTGWTVVAVTGPRFAAFAPYVPSISDSGLVSFQAALAEGGSGIVLWAGTEATMVAAPGVSEAISHPDVNDAGAVSFYAVLTDGSRAVVKVMGDEVVVLADTRARFREIGPAGPTMNESGAVAFRALDVDGRPGIYAADMGAVHVVATAGAEWLEFHGLPVVTRSGAVVFRATPAPGRDGIYFARAGTVRPVVETGPLYATLGFFPSVSNDEVVGFAATLRSGGGGIFSATPDGTIAAVVHDEAFESYRGALISASDSVVSLATPRGRSLGLFRGADPVRDRLLAIDDSLLGSTVVEVAANPVSINRQGRIAARASLADGRQVILVTP